MDQQLRRAVLIVALLNLGYFGVEFAVALAIGSVSLFADSIDFLEDAAVNLLILAALGWTARKRALVGMALAATLLMPGIATVWTAWDKFTLPLAPARPANRRRSWSARGQPDLRFHSGSISPPQWLAHPFLSAHNNAFANVAIVAAGLTTAFLWRSAWPDLIVGLGILVLNLDAARQVFRAAIQEHAQTAAASLLLLVSGLVAPNVLGYAFVIGQALVVAAFAELQYMALRRQAMAA